MRNFTKQVVFTALNIVCPLLQKIYLWKSKGTELHGQAFINRNCSSALLFSNKNTERLYLWINEGKNKAKCIWHSARSCEATFSNNSDPFWERHADPYTCPRGTPTVEAALKKVMLFSSACLFASSLCNSTFGKAQEKGNDHSHYAFTNPTVPELMVSSQSVSMIKRLFSLCRLYVRSVTIFTYLIWCTLLYFNP